MNATKLAKTKSKAKINSLKALKAHMQKALNSEKVSPLLAEAVRSQGMLADYKFRDDILGMSLNSHKKYARVAFGNYEKLNQLRLKLLTLVESGRTREFRNSTRSKAALAETLSDQKIKLERGRHDNMMLSIAIKRAIELSLSLMEGMPEERQRYVRQEIKRIRAIVGSEWDDGGEGNVTDISQAQAKKTVRKSKR